MSQLAPFSSYSTETVCRCCLAEECSKDIFNEYFWMGKREVYSEMLFEAFNVAIEHSSSKDLNSIGHLICEPCISKLRDASDFKKQVVRSDKALRERINCRNNAAFNEPVKLEIKSELKEIDNYNEYHDLFNEEDDHPLKRVKKNCQKIKIDNLEITKKKSKGIKIRPKKAKLSINTDTCDSGIQDQKGDRCEPARSNAQMIVRNTTAYPFRVNDKSIVCVYCQELYEDPEFFREHMHEEHQSFNLKIAFHNLPKTEFIKADVTDLKCRQCSEKFEDLQSIGEHLKNVHMVPIYCNEKIGVMPYVLHTDVYNCAICRKNFPSLFHLNRHTIKHFLSFVCHVCGSSYIASTGLLRHVRLKHQQYEVSCKRCNKVFPSMEAKDKHRRTEKLCMPYCCQKCPERFLDYNAKKKHMESKHGQSQKHKRCADCNIDFASDSLYYEHHKLQHSNDCSVCKHCGLKFLSRSRLQRHLVKHSY